MSDDTERARIRQPHDSAAGARAVVETLRHAVGKAGLGRGVGALLRVNQPGGFDCPGCAWPEDSAHRKRAEFCENGAKAVADEATRKTIGADFFARHTLTDLADRSGRWLNEQGRLAEPVVRRPGSDRYEPIGWDDAFALIARELGALESPDEAVFYTSGRTSNEAAFLYQLLARQFGTNNLPDFVEPVPRVERRRDDRGDRQRQGHGQPRGLRPRRRDFHLRPEPRLESSAHARDAAGRPSARRENRQHQSAA